MPEVWVIDRDTKVPEVYLLKAGLYVLKAPDSDGWVASDYTGIEMRPSGQGKLSVRIGKDDSTREDLPAP